MALIKSANIASEPNKKWRPTMEDTHIIKKLNIQHPTFSELVLCGVFDGHGGKEVADFCQFNISKMLTQIIKHKPHDNPCDWLITLYENIDLELAKRNIMDAGATVATCLLTRNTNNERAIHSANVGDTRAVLISRHKHLRLTYDHKSMDPSEVERIYRNGGYIENERVNGIFNISRALGDMYMKKHMINKPFCSSKVLNNNDTHLVIACDGVWDVLSDTYVFDLVKKYKNTKDCAYQLVKSALDNDSTDNITAIVIQL
jgi:protein phosphatase PTC1